MLGLDDKYTLLGGEHGGGLCAEEFPGSLTECTAKL